jgi:hypothetical protein
MRLLSSNCRRATYHAKEDFMNARFLSVVGKDGAIYETESDRELFEEAVRRHCMTVMEIADFIRGLLMAEADPIQAKGERFEFKKPPRDYIDFGWINPRVPAPDAAVDLFEAIEEMKRDAKACEFILNYEPSHSNVLRVIQNEISWSRFFAGRWPTPEGREAFRAMVAVHEATIRSLAARARRKGQRGQELAERLEQVMQ